MRMPSEIRWLATVILAGNAALFLATMAGAYLILSFAR